MHGVGQPVHLLPGEEAEREGWLGGLSRPPGRFHRRLRLSQRHSGVIEERPSRSGEFDAAGATRQELRADFVLQIADLAAERRLRRVQPAFGRDGEAALLGHRHEIPKMAQLHISLHAYQA